ALPRAGSGPLPLPLRTSRRGRAVPDRGALCPGRLTRAAEPVTDRIASSDRGARPAVEAGRRGRSGRLGYVMGPSGAGKDSLIASARGRLGPDAGVVFAHRYIPRPADSGGENHVALSDAEFDLRLASGCFGLHWRSHGHRYGLGCEIDVWLARGLHVVANGSRVHLEAAARRYPDLLPLLVEIDPEVLRARLHRRGRETAAEIE